MGYCLYVYFFQWHDHDGFSEKRVSLKSEECQKIECLE
ncbi:hypothetical protein [Coxiella burnetii]|uniref:Uncharacterized protein n=1 Tax=Coxiella burnetii (strain RSA 493 / Nine Mile phase I) TaxID=227377 RepID=Q83C23_COXBU|nr:hypothetical protein [Coxiella burnetii]NP_820303.1 hypothetical protein CBU_1312 [Coxiella burnetii RSA 493]AAO90817.1 hypothetical protein CBU_1312 [Coxiella burnetii RSA 493]ABX78384.1 hypothetical protein COXBURSA331_A1463 [Coxiella burnetii RSA 331]AML48821.1 hypothetical protein AUR58_06270 [Coxiella burnetii]AML54785.1 hypothetical protein AYM38_05565 [Coxiella burnetii]ARI66101.1 hypothetical protein B7L74_06765 [Coxiella burnetii]